jgi:FkbM family methyltransferase
MILPIPLKSEEEKIHRALGACWRNYSDDLSQLLHLRWLGFTPQTIFDIGSSNTVWSVTAHMVFPDAEFQLFEPLAELSDAYLTGKRTHPAICRFLETANFRLHAVALGTKNGTCPFRWFENNDSGSTSLGIDGDIPGSKLVDVPMRRLDDLVLREDLATPDLIKLDTQGSEMEILAGAPDCLKRAKVVFLESWLTKGYGAKTPLMLEMANMLAEYNFDLFSVGDEYRNQEGILQTKDLVFVKRDLNLVAEPLLEATT